jgi:hypothetical protein
LVALLLVHSACGLAAEPLGTFPVDPMQVSVAGISSGAFMANQVHVAHSADVMGAAMIAGGLYGCALEGMDTDGVLALASRAIGPCMSLPFMLKDISWYVDTVKRLATKRWIDPPSNLARAKIYFFTGSSDAVIDPEAVAKGEALYPARTRG